MSYVQSVYLSSPGDAPGSAAVAGPCMLRGIWVVPLASASANVAPVEFRNGSITGSVLLKLDCGETAAANPSSGQQFLDFPGLGIRFDTSLWVKGSGTSTAQVTSLTLLVSGTNP
jgi:hypothetical protein